MPYFLSPDDTPLKDRLIEIDRERHENIRASRALLAAALPIEEKINIVIANFEDFEKELLDRTLNSVLYASSHSLSVHYEIIHSFNRRLVNLTATCRLYNDHILQDIGRIFGENSAEVATVKSKQSSEYDAKLSYRAMEAIRNYAQHQTLPVSAFTAASD